MRNLQQYIHTPYEEYNQEEVDKKSKEFLRTVMGNEKFEKLQKYGKIEIESSNNKNNSKTDKKVIYELYANGRVVNKTKNQHYCLVADRSDYPNDDMVAIKFAWLTHRSDIAEKVANKTNLNTGTRVNRNRTTTGYADFISEMEQRGWNSQSIAIGDSPYYGDYVDYLSGNGWKRELIVINEHSTDLAYTKGVRKDNTGCIIDITCPPGRKMTFMGRRQVPLGVDPNMAYYLGLYIADENDKEIPDNTKIRIAKVKPSEDVVQLARVYYSDVKMKDGKAVYSFTQGIELNGEVHFMIFVVDSRCNIPDENIKFKIETDIWAVNV